MTETDRSADALVADARRAVHEALVVLAAPEADRVRALVADLETAVEGRTAIRMSAPAPAPSGGALRDRIAVAIAADDGHPWDTLCADTQEQYLDNADAVLAVLPPSVDRATVLREAADELGRMDYDTDANDYGYDTYRDAWNGGVMDGADLLRRLIAEVPQSEQVNARCGQDIETALGTYPCERDAGHDGDCDERTETELREGAAELRRLAAETQQQTEAAPSGWSSWRELLLHAVDKTWLRSQGVDSAEDLLAAFHREQAAEPQQTQSEMLPQTQGPEYTPCVCGHIEPEHEPNAGACLSCDCEAYQPCTCGSAGDAFIPAGHYRDCPQAAAPVPVEAAANAEEQGAEQ